MRYPIALSLAIPSLREALSNEDREGKLRMIAALRRTGSLGIPDLKTAAEEEDAVVRAAALNALEQMKSPRHLEDSSVNGGQDPASGTMEDLKSARPKTP